MPKSLYIGFDVGTEYVHSAVLNEDELLVHNPKSRMHFGNPTTAINEVLNHLERNVNSNNLNVSFTGNGGSSIAQATDSNFFYDTVTIPVGANYLDTDAKYVFHLGSKDPYFFEKSSEEIDGNKRLHIPDSASGSKCGGGSGILITKQCRRFFDSDSDVTEIGDLQSRIEKMYEKAYESAIKYNKELNVGGRCGVVIQSDMIHLQNDGEQINNILRGMFERIAINYKNDVIGVRRLNQNERAIATGGVSANRYIIEMLSKHTGIPISVPYNFEKVGAIGAALKLKENNHESNFKREGLENILDAERTEIKYVEPLSSALPNIFIFPEPDEVEKYGNVKVYRQNFDSDHEVTEAVLGVDGGSTTTKAILANVKTLESIGEAITATHGKPLEAIQGLFRDFRDSIGDKVDIRAVAYTGSSGGFYQRLFTKPSSNGKKSVDLIKDEITCHGLGVKHYEKDVDTIFELGGQDAKFTVFNNGTVKKSKMNLSCMAGTGQTMENMMKMIGLNYDEFEEYVLRAERTPVVDETCGVFTESGIAKLISLGLPKEEIAAAIAYGFIGGYVNKFVGNEKFGNCISAQGGPFNNKANLAALALHTGKKINAFPHRQLFGAYGAALAAYKTLLEEGGLN